MTTETQEIPEMTEDNNSRPKTRTPSTYSNRKFKKLIRSRGSLGWTGEAVTYLKHHIEEILDRLVKEAERVHHEDNVNRSKDGERVRVNVTYEAVREAVGKSK